jgi:hypothetical protein
MAEMICESMPHIRYTDPPLAPAVPGELCADAIERFAEIWRSAVNLDTNTLATLTGRVLTESVHTVSPLHDTESVETALEMDQPLRVAPFSRFAWCAPAPVLTDQWLDGTYTGTLRSGGPGLSGQQSVESHSVGLRSSGQQSDQHVQLFVDGEVRGCSHALAVDLCSIGLEINARNERYTSEDRKLLENLLLSGAMVAARTT